MALPQPIEQYETARQWAAGLREQWGEDIDMTSRYAALERFCELTGQDPDAMIAACTREVESGKRIRVKARREYSEKIAEFQESVEGNARQQMAAGNLIRSFFIHNGIFMQAGLAE